jgi:hypothetical protein
MGQDGIRELLRRIESTFSDLFGSSPITLRVIALLVLVLMAGSLIAYFAWKQARNRRMGLRQHTIDSVAWRPGFRLTAEVRQRFMDDTNPELSRVSVFEYILYAAILITTALAVVFYKASLTDTQLTSLNVHVGVFYFGFMAWVLSRLHAMYQKRKLARPVQRSIHTELLQEPVARAPHRTQEPVESARPTWGLTSIQLAILVVVFITALTAFSCALKILK